MVAGSDAMRRRMNSAPAGRGITSQLIRVGDPRHLTYRPSVGAARQRPLHRGPCVRRVQTFLYLIKAAPCGRRAALCPMQPQALARGVRPAGRSPRGARLPPGVEAVPRTSAPEDRTRANTEHGDSPRPTTSTFKELAMIQAQDTHAAESQKTRVSRQAARSVSSWAQGLLGSECERIFRVKQARTTPGRAG